MKTEYWIGTQSLALFNPVHKISREEWLLLDQAIVTVLETEQPFHYRLMESNYAHLKSTYRFAETILSLGRDFAPGIDRTRLGESVMTAVVNWLSSMRMYLDHQETLLKRKYGATATEYGAFKSATSNAYDSLVGYRFAYKFRNYVQHCGAPLSSIQFTLPPAESTSRFKQVVKLVVNRDSLLSEYHEWSVVRNDILAMPGEFEILPLLSAAMSGLRTIHKACQEFLLDHALAQAPLLAEAINRLIGVEGDPTLFKIEHPEPGVVNYAPRLMQKQAVFTLLDVTENRTSRDSLWALGQADESPSSLDPETFRQMFHRTNRGVQIISAWLHEGGSTPQFDSIVTDIFSEDRGIEPAVTGLINASVVFASMLAILMGTTAPALITNLLDQYSESDVQRMD